MLKKLDEKRNEFNECELKKKKENKTEMNNETK